MIHCTRVFKEKPGVEHFGRAAALAASPYTYTSLVIAAAVQTSTNQCANCARIYTLPATRYLSSTST